MLADQKSPNLPQNRLISPIITKKKNLKVCFRLKRKPGAGGEIRDRLAGGKGSLPLAGTAVYMTAYSRLEEEKPWEKGMPARKWLYQTPIDILIKASNGASDFGNKFGQPLIAGSVLTFENETDGRRLGYDKVIMQAPKRGIKSSF